MQYVGFEVPTQRHTKNYFYVQKNSLTFWASTVEKCIVLSVSHESIRRMFAILRHRGLCPTPPSRGDRLILRSKTSVKFTIVSERGYYRTVFLPKTADNAGTSSFKESKATILKILEKNFEMTKKLEILFFSRKLFYQRI